MYNTDDLVPIEKTGKETYLFVGKRADDSDDDIVVMLTKADDEEKAEKIFLNALGTESQDYDEEAANEDAYITMYKITV